MNETKPRPFDERSALDELERLAEKIQSTRRQRERAVAEFNAFVKTFKDEDHATRVAALQPVVRAEAPVPPRPPVAPIAPTIERRAAEPATPPPAPTPAPPAPVMIGADNDAEPIAWTASKSKSPSLDLSALLATPRGRIGLAAAGLLVVVLLVSWLVGQSGNATPDNEPAAAPAAQTPPSSTPTPAPAAAAPSTPTPVASTGVPRALNVVLMTSRPVWTRVIVDDRKVIERELPGSQTIPLGADRAIAIRAGDAGAIRLVVDGKDIGIMGRDGQIGSRAFTAQAPANR